MKKLILIILIVLSFGNSQTVTLDPIPILSYCTGDAYTISFQVSGGAFNPGNIFTLELSDNSGSFSSPTSLGTLNITGSGSFNGIWGVLPYGTGYLVRVTATDPLFTSPPSTSSLTLSPVLNGNTIGSHQTVCAGNGITLTGSLPSGGSGTYIYQWESSSDDLGWSNISGQTNQNMSSITPSVTSYFRRKAESVNSVCAALYSGSIRIDVLPVIGNNTILSDETICAGITISGITGSVPTGGTGSYSYQWQSSINLISWQTIPGFTAQDFNYNAGLSATTYFRRSVSDVFCNNNSGHIQITVIPAIGNNIIGNNQTLCLGNGSATITGTLPSGGEGSYAYQWQTSNDNSVWSAITGATLISYAPGLVGSTTYFRRGVTASLCNAFTNTVTILIVPVLTNNLIGANQTICSGGSPALFTGTLPNGGNNQFVYQWETSLNNTVWTALSGTTSQNLNYLQSMSSSLYFRRIVTNTFCSFSTSAAVFVSVIPVLTNNTVGSNQTLCQGSSATLTGTLPLGGTGIYSYQWFSSTNNSSWFSISGATVVNHSPGILISSTYFYRNIISGPCTSNSTSILVTMNNLIGNNLIGNAQTICSGLSFSSLTGSIPSGGNGVYSYQWQSSSNQTTWSNIVGSTNIGFNGISLTNTTYYRRIVTSNPCAASTSGDIQILVNPVPSAVITNTGNLTFCQGDSVVLSVPASSSYAWSNGANTQSISVFGSNTYSVQVSNSFGCTTNSSIVSTTMNPLPTPAISGASTLCAGNSTVLSTTSFNTYLWNTGHTTQSIQINSAGSYSVRVQGSNGCFGNSAAFVLSVLPNPIPSITPSGALSFCQGGSVSLNGGTFASHKWNTGSTNQSINVLTSGFYVDTVTNSQGCRAWSSIQVIVNSLPQPVIIPAGSTTFCSGESLMLFLGSGYSSYLWSTGATTSSISVSNTGTYQVSVTDQNGCSGTSSSLSTTVHPIPTVGIVANGSTSFCQGNSVSLSASGAISYVWSNGATGSGIVVSTSGSYSVTGTSNGCSSVSGIIPLTVTNPAPVQIFASGPTTFCQGDSVILTATPGSSYSWSTGATASSITVKTNSTISVTVTTNGCPVASSQVFVISNPVPTPSITASGSLTICPGDTVILSSSLGSGYSWSNGSTTRSIPVSQAGTYNVRVVNGFGCGATSAALMVQLRIISTPVIQTSTSSYLCQGDSVLLSSPVRNSYLWSTGDTSRTIIVKSAGMYSLSVIDSFGCFSSATPVQVMVFGLPVPSINSNGPLNFCQGSSVQLASVDSGRYLWSTGDTTRTITMSQSGTIKLILTDRNGCKGETTQIVSVNARPTPNFQVQTVDDFCRGQQLILSADSVYDGYLWSNGSTSNSISVQNSGEYSLIVTRNGCSGSKTKEVLLGYLPPVGKLVVKADKIETGILVCREEDKNYMWGFEPKINPSGLESYACIADCRSWIQYDKLDTANYYYWVYVGDATCMRKWYFNAAVTFRLSKEKLKAQILNVYPNPATDLINIHARFDSGLEGEVSIELMDLQGRMIFTRQFNPSGSELQYLLNTSIYPKGTYFLRVEGRGSIWVEKVLIN